MLGGGGGLCTGGSRRATRFDGVAAVRERCTGDTATLPQTRRPAATVVALVDVAQRSVVGDW